MAFKRQELREILGEAYTDDIGTKLVNLHRGVIDPLRDELDTAKNDVARYKTEADKVPDLEKRSKILRAARTTRKNTRTNTPPLKTTRSRYCRMLRPPK